MQTPTEKQESVLRTYVNDMVALERDIANAIEGQHSDGHVEAKPDVQRLLIQIASRSAARRDVLAGHAEVLGGGVGAVLKESVTAVTGILAALYAKVRPHPVSRMLRDDVTALNLAATAYGMLYTTALAYGHEQLAETALRHLDELPAQIMEISSLIPGVIVEELAKDDPSVNMEAAEVACEAIEQVWVTSDRMLQAA